MPFSWANETGIMLTGSGIGFSSVGSSTMVSTWKRSTLPRSSSKWALRFRSMPKCFLAALAMASSRMATSVARSMPLSLATWSRIRFRFTFCCMATPSSSDRPRSRTRGWPWRSGRRGCGGACRPPRSRPRRPRKPRSVPVQCLRGGSPGALSIGPKVFTLARWPAKRSKSVGLRSGRSTPGRADLEVVGRLDEVLHVEDGLRPGARPPGSRRCRSRPPCRRRGAATQRPPSRSHSTSTSS